MQRRGGVVFSRLPRSGSLSLPVPLLCCVPPHRTSAAAGTSFCISGVDENWNFETRVIWGSQILGCLWCQRLKEDCILRHNSVSVSSSSFDVSPMNASHVIAFLQCCRPFHSQISKLYYSRVRAAMERRWPRRPPRWPNGICVGVDRTQR